MAYDLATIRDRILDDKLQDTSYDPDPLNNFINDAQREIFNTFELSFQEKIFAGSLAGGGYLYAFPADYQQSQSLVISGANNYIQDLTDHYIDFRSFNARFPSPGTNTAGVPRAWTIYAGKILFDRPTDQSYILSLFYLKKPDTLTADNQVPEIPEEFSELLVLGGYIRALERNEDFDQAAFVRNNDYQRILDLMVARLGKKQTGRGQTARLPRNGGMRASSRS